MWPSPSKIPTSTSFVSSGRDISALSALDKRLIPFVEVAVAVLNERLGIKDILKSRSRITFYGLCLHC
jgi:hypothetical protein